LKHKTLARRWVWVLAVAACWIGPWTARGQEGAAESPLPQEGPPLLVEACFELAGALASRVPGHKESGTVVVLPAGGSALAGYVAALMPPYLEQLGWRTMRVCGGIELRVPRGKPQPERLPARVLWALGREGFAMLAGAELGEDAKRGSVSGAVYSLRDGKVLGAARVEFSMPPSHSFLASGERPERDARDVEWAALFDRLFPPAEEERGDLQVRIEVAEGLYYFRRGFWKQSAERLLPLTEAAPTARFMRLIMALELAGEGQRAAELLQTAIKEHPDTGPLYALRGWLLVREGSNKDGVLLLDQARVSDVAREGYYRYARALMALEQGDGRKAEEALLKASELLVGQSFVHLKVARFYWEGARLEEAIRFYRRALEADGKSAQIWSELGTALDAMGDATGAVQAFRQALSLDPYRWHVARDLSSLLERRGEYAAALEVLRKAADASPDEPDVLASYGDAAAHRWLIDEAKRAFEAALALDSSFVYGKMRLAQVRASERDYGPAEHMLRQVLEAAPDYVPAAIALGRVLIAQGRTDEAIFELAGTRKDSDYEVSRKLALSFAYLQSGRHAEAVENAQVAVGISPEPRSYAMLARAFILSGEPEKAQMAAERAMESGSKSVVAHLAMARVLRASGQFETALQHCQKAIELDPFQVEALSLCGDLFLETGKAGGAAAVWRRAVELDRWNAEMHWKLAELLRQRLGDADGALLHYRRCVELGGPRAGEAARRVRELQKTAPRR